MATLASPCNFQAPAIPSPGPIPAKAQDLPACFPVADGDVPAEMQWNEPYIQKQYLVGGVLKEWNGEMHDIYSPVFVGDKQKLLGKTPALDEPAALAAMDAAVKAYDNGNGQWPQMTTADRIRHMEDFVIAMKKKRSVVVKFLMWEIGKITSEAEREFDRTIEYIVDTIEALKDLDRSSSRFTIVNGILGQIRRSPMGVVLCMGPYNYPLNETFTTLIPSIIMGNTVVFKPAKYGVLLIAHLLEAFRDCFPPGVVNTVYGEGRTIVGPMMKSGKIDVLAFIGTSKVADHLKQQHPKPHRLRCTLGLDAKNPAIVMPDADIELAVKECVLGALTFNGQRCTALKIIFVHTNIVDKFLARFSATIEAMKLGMPWTKGAAITPLPEKGKPEYCTELIADAKKHGAKVVNPQGGNCNKTLFFPAVLYPCNEKMRVYHEEQFGPVVPIVPFSDVMTPLNYVVESHFGQQVSIFSNNSDEIAKLIDPLVNQVSRVNINAQCQRSPDTFPFTGRKDSAEGTLSVADALRVFSIRAIVAAKKNPQTIAILNDIVRNHKSNFLSTNFIL